MQNEKSISFFLYCLGHLRVKMNHQSLPINEKGTYILLLRMENAVTIRIGRKGVFLFPKGFYAYVGSAMGPGGIGARVNHHLTTSKKPHWHMDYLKSSARIFEVWWGESEKPCEHDWAAAIGKIPASVIPFRGFGSTDCRCPTHLYYFRKKPRFKEFQKIFGPKIKPEHRMEVNKSGKGEGP